MAQIHCPDCGAVIPSKNINIQKMMAVCEQCGSVFQLEDRIASKTKLRKIKPPENFDVVEGDNSLKISYLYRKNLGVMEKFVLFLTTIGLFGSSALAVMVLAKSEPLVLLIIGPVILLTLWVLATYMLDRAQITVEDNEIKFSESPIYGFSNRSFNRDEVERVYCAPSESTEQDSPSTYQRVTLVKTDGTEQNLMNYAQRHIAFYVMQMVQEYLDSEPESTPFVDEESENSEDDVVMSQLTARLSS